MRRYLATMGVVILSGLLLGSLLVGAFLSPGRQPETWETALRRYLEFKRLDGDELWQIAIRERAISPTRFDRALSRVSYGTGTYYQTQVTYPAVALAPTDQQVIHRAATPMPTGVKFFAATAGRPLPYPPDDVWCVLLTQAQDPVELSQDLLAFVALHIDLYNAEWVVHETGIAPFGGEILGGLHAIGCDGVLDMVSN
jgi:hypothetical protein